LKTLFASTDITHVEHSTGRTLMLTRVVHVLVVITWSASRYQIIWEIWFSYP